MKKVKNSILNTVSVLSSLLIIATVTGIFLISEYGKNTEETPPAKDPVVYSPPHNAYIPDLFHSDADDPTEVLPEVVLPPEVGDGEELIPEEELLPRDKYGLPYPKTERPAQVVEASVPASTKEGYEYFDNSVFLGDSVTLGLKNHVVKQRQKDKYYLGSAQFIAVGSYSVADTLVPVDSEKAIHQAYKGEILQPQDIIAKMGVQRVFICLGLNDVGIYTKTEYLNNYSVLINRIRMATEDIQIVILPVTPLTLEGERRVLYNAKIDEYNEALALFAKENGCYFVDIAMLLKDEEGYLTFELSSDNYCHLMPEAYNKIIDYMMLHCIPTLEEEKALEEAGGGPIHIDKGVPEVEGWEGSAGEP